MKNTYTSFTNSSSANQHAGKVIYIIKVCLIAMIAILVMVLKSSAADSTHISAKNAFYIQFAGEGNYHSVNFERVFRSGRNLNFSYSIGYSPTKTSTSIPISINAFTTGKQHHFEMSIAVIPHVEKHVFSKTTDLDKQLYVKPSVGYRYQKTTKGLFVKVGAGPQIFMDPPSTNIWAFTPKLIGISAQMAVGISF